MRLLAHLSLRHYQPLKQGAGHFTAYIKLFNSPGFLIKGNPPAGDLSQWPERRGVMTQSSNAPASYLLFRNVINEGLSTMSKINKDFKNLSLAFVVITLGMVAVPIGIGAIYAGDSCKKSILLPCIGGDE